MQENRVERTGGLPCDPTSRSTTDRLSRDGACQSKRWRRNQVSACDKREEGDWETYVEGGWGDVGLGGQRIVSIQQIIGAGSTGAGNDGY